MKRKNFLMMILLIMINYGAYGMTKEIALTIDDLPFVGSADHNEKKLQRKHDRFMQMLNTLKDKQIPATGFVIAGSIEKGQWELLEAFRNAGLGLGNHTDMHCSLNSVPAEKYIEDIAKADQKLSPILTEPKFFRYPYLAEGTGDKRKQVQDFLLSLHYLVAPVTIDSKDYQFNEQLYRIPYQARPAQLPLLINRYLSYIWSQTLRAEKRLGVTPGEDKPVKQVLLIHANLLNSHALGAIIEMFQNNGYRFVPLTDVVPENPMPIQNLHSLLRYHLRYHQLALG